MHCRGSSNYLYFSFSMWGCIFPRIIFPKTASNPSGAVNTCESSASSTSCDCDWGGICHSIGWCQNMAWETSSHELMSNTAMGNLMAAHKTRANIAASTHHALQHTGLAAFPMFTWRGSYSTFCMSCESLPQFWSNCLLVDKSQRNNLKRMAMNMLRIWCFYIRCSNWFGLDLIWIWFTLNLNPGIFCFSDVCCIWFGLDVSCIRAGQIIWPSRAVPNR